MTGKKKTPAAGGPGPGRRDEDTSLSHDPPQESSQKGWIALHRQLLDSQVFQNEGLLKVWIWCLLKARHKPGWITMKVGRAETEIWLETGQFVYGRKSASRQLRMKSSSVRNRMQKLKNMQNLDIESNTHYSVVTIINWDAYQDKKIKEDTEKDSRRTAGGQPEDTNNNVVTMNNNGGTTTSSCRENSFSEKQPASKKQSTEDEILYANHVTDEAWRAGKITGSKAGYRQGVLNRIAAGQVDRDEIIQVTSGIEAARLAGKFRKFIQTIPGMEPAEKERLLWQLAAGTYEIRMDGERIEYAVDMVENELKEINAVDDYMQFDDIREEVKNQTRQETR